MTASGWPSGAPDRTQVRSLDDYRRAAAGVFKADPDGCFAIWPSQLEIHHACLTLAARAALSSSAPQVDSSAARGARNCSQRRRPGTTRYDSAVVSFLTRCADYVAVETTNGRGQGALAALSGLLDETVGWTHPTEVRIHADAFIVLFDLKPTDWRNRGDPYGKARDLLKLAQRVSISAGRKPALVEPTRTENSTREKAHAFRSGLPGRFYVCVAWQERLDGAGGRAQGMIERIGAPSSRDQEAVLHRLAGLTGYSLEKCWIQRRLWAKPVGKPAGAYRRRWTSVLLHRWLEEAATKIGDDSELQDLLTRALARLEELRTASAAEDASIVKGSPISVLWLRENEGLPLASALPELERLWELRRLVEAKYARRIQNGRERRRAWTIAMRKDYGYRCLDPHEFWRVGW